MDIRCTTCGEPWDHDSLHEIAEDRAPYEGQDYEKAWAWAVQQFHSLGCEALGCSHNAVANVRAASIADVLFDVMGDDTDGIAAMLEDAEWMGAL